MVQYLVMRILESAYGDTPEESYAYVIQQRSDLKEGIDAELESQGESQIITA